MPSGLADALRRNRYAALLALLLVSLAVQSLGGRSGPGGLLADIVRTVLAVAIFLVVFERRRERIGAAALLVAIIAIGWLRRYWDGSADFSLSLALHALIAVYLWAAVWVILRELFRTPSVGAENVLGSICGYLIAGDAWGDVNAFTYLLVPAAYSINQEVNVLLADWHGRMALFSYYSLAQMLTIGYGDVTPVRAPATTLSLFGTLFGVFYAAIVVSQFVGLAQSRRDESHDKG